MLMGAVSLNSNHLSCGSSYVNQVGSTLFCLSLRFNDGRPVTWTLQFAIPQTRTDTLFTVVRLLRVHLPTLIPHLSRPIFPRRNLLGCGTSPTTNSTGTKSPYPYRRKQRLSSSLQSLSDVLFPDVVSNRYVVFCFDGWYDSWSNS